MNAISTVFTVRKADGDTQYLDSRTLEFSPTDDYALHYFHGVLTGGNIEIYGVSPTDREVLLAVLVGDGEVAKVDARPYVRLKVQFNTTDTDALVSSKAFSIRWMNNF